MSEAIGRGIGNFFSYVGSIIGFETEEIEEYEETPVQPEKESRVVDFNEVKGKTRNGAKSGKSAFFLEGKTIHEPTKYEGHVEEIANEILNRQVVVVNLNNVMSKDVPRERERIVQFLFGVCYSTGAKVSEIDANILTIAPKGLPVKDYRLEKEVTNEIYRKKEKDDKHLEAKAQ